MFSSLVFIMTLLQSERAFINSAQANLFNYSVAATQNVMNLVHDPQT